MEQHDKVLFHWAMGSLVSLPSSFERDTLRSGFIHFSGRRRHCGSPLMDRSHSAFMFEPRMAEQCDRTFVKCNMCRSTSKKTQLAYVVTFSYNVTYRRDGNYVTETSQLTRLASFCLYSLRRIRRIAYMFTFTNFRSHCTATRSSNMVSMRYKSIVLHLVDTIILLFHFASK